MTEYTRENPFEFEGVKVWRNETGRMCWDTSHRSSTHHGAESIARADHAFLEAERDAREDSWHEDGDGFRKGRLSVAFDADADDTPEAEWYIGHDDFPNLFTCKSYGRSGSVFEDSMLGHLDNFLTWHAATYPPKPVEPTGLGAVVEVASSRYVSTGDGDWWLYGKHSSWAEITKRGPVTILSHGFES